MTKRMSALLPLMFVAVFAASSVHNAAVAQDDLAYKPGKSASKKESTDKADSKKETEKAEKKQSSEKEEAEAKPKKKGFFGRMFSKINPFKKSKSKKEDKAGDNKKPDQLKDTEQQADGNKAEDKEQKAADKKQKEAEENLRKAQKAQEKKDKAAAKALAKKEKAEKKRKDAADKAYGEITKFLESMGEKPDQKTFAKNYGEIKSSLDKLVKHFDDQHPYYAGLMLYRARAAGAASDRHNYEKYWVEALEAMRSKTMAEDNYQLLIEASARAAELGLVQASTYFGELAAKQSKILYSDRAAREIFMINTNKIRGMAKNMKWNDIKEALDEYMYFAEKSFTYADAERLEAIYTDCEFWHSYAPNKEKDFDKRLKMSEKLSALELAFQLHRNKMTYREQKRYLALINEVKKDYKL